MEKPSGAMRCSFEAVTAQRRATLPVFGGMSGFTSTTFMPAGWRNCPCARALRSVFESVMSGLAIIANPHAHRNRLWPLASQALRKAAPGVPLLEARAPREPQQAAKQIAAERPRVVAIAGGDGTVTH